MENSQSSLSIDQFGADRFYEDQRPASVNPYRHLNGSSSLNEAYASQHYYDYHSSHSSLGSAHHIQSSHHHLVHQDPYQHQPSSFSAPFHHSPHLTNYPASYSDPTNLYGPHHCPPPPPPPPHPEHTYPPHQYAHHPHHYYDRVTQPELSGLAYGHETQQYSGRHSTQLPPADTISSYSKSSSYDAVWDTNSVSNSSLSGIGTNGGLPPPGHSAALGLNAGANLIGSCPPTPQHSAGGSVHGSSSIRSPSQSNSSWSPRTTPSPLSPHPFSHTRRSPGHALGNGSQGLPHVPTPLVSPSTLSESLAGNGLPPYVNNSIANHQNALSNQIAGGHTNSSSPLQSLHKMLDESRESAKVYDVSLAKVFSETEPELNTDEASDKQENSHPADSTGNTEVNSSGQAIGPDTTDIVGDNSLAPKEQKIELETPPKSPLSDPSPIIKSEDSASYQNGTDSHSRSQSINGSESNPSSEKSPDENSIPIGSEKITMDAATADPIVNGDGDGMQRDAHNMDSDEVHSSCPNSNQVATEQANSLRLVTSPTFKSGKTRKRKKSEGESLLASNRSSSLLSPSDGTLPSGAQARDPSADSIYSFKLDPEMNCSEQGFGFPTPKRKGRPKGSKNKPKDPSKVSRPEILQPKSLKRKRAGFIAPLKQEIAKIEHDSKHLLQSTVGTDTSQVNVTFDDDVGLDVSQPASMTESNKTSKKKLIGPFVRVEKKKSKNVSGPNSEATDSIASVLPARYRVINAPLKELDGTKSKMVYKPARCFMDLKLKSPPPTATANGKGKRAATAMVRANAAGDSSWVCTLCHLPSHSKGLGVLFGPYQLSQDTASEASSGSLTGNEKLNAGINAGKLASPSKSPKRNSRSGSKLTPEPVKLGRALRGKRASEESLAPVDESDSEIWLHEDCVVWSEGVCVLGNEIVGLEQIIRDSKSIICSKCDRYGASLGCVQRKCANRFHFWCAKESGCDMDDEQMIIHCAAHKQPTSAKTTLA